MDLQNAFNSFYSCKQLFKNLMAAFENTDPAVTVLALEGLYRMEKDVNRGQFSWNGDDFQQCQDFLRKWRNGFREYVNNTDIPSFVPTNEILQSLTVFPTLDIDNMVIKEEAINYPRNMDLLDAFYSWDSCKCLFKNMMAAFENTDRAVAVLALEGLYRMEKDVNRGQFSWNGDDFQQCQDFLRKWRNGFWEHVNNTDIPSFVPTNRILQSLTIFSTLHIDNMVIKEEAINYPENVDLLCAFYSWDSCKGLFKNMMAAFENTDPAVTVLALEGLYRMEKDVNRGQFSWNGDDFQQCQDFLRKWRNGFREYVNNTDIPSFVPTNRILQSLTIFLTLHIDNMVIKEEAINYPENVDLLCAFNSCDSCKCLFKNLMAAFENTDPAVAVVALEGLHRMEKDVNRGQFSWNDDDLQQCKNFLRKWRNNCPSVMNPSILKSITIFTTLRVPIFSDDYGTKEPPSNFAGGMKSIDIDGLTPIAHVTHREEAEQIVKERQFRPSANKNVIEGCWFGFESMESVYGSKSFRMTLDLLGVTGLRQGEIVSYKNEINVILYATRDAFANFEGLVKPSQAVFRVKRNNPNLYVKVSIFVSSEMLLGVELFNLIESPVDIKHGPFCIRAKRSFTDCKELE